MPPGLTCEPYVSLDVWMFQVKEPNTKLKKKLKKLKTPSLNPGVWIAPQTGRLMTQCPEPLLGLRRLLLYRQNTTGRYSLKQVFFLVDEIDLLFGDLPSWVVRPTLV